MDRWTTTELILTLHGGLEEITLYEWQGQLISKVGFIFDLCDLGVTVEEKLQRNLS